MSRLGRNYLQVGFYTEILFPQKDVRFLAINNSIDSNNASDNDFAPFLNIMNEFYAKDTSNKIKAVFDARMKDGKRCSGSIPYGYNRLPSDKQTLVVDPVASEVVKRIFLLANEGKSPRAIAEILTEEKALIPAAYAKEYHPEQYNGIKFADPYIWGISAIRTILSRQEYLGHKIIKFYPQEIARRSDVIAGLKSDIERVAEHPKPSDETFVGMTVKGAFYSEKADAGNAILEACKAMTNPDPIPLGEYRGFTMELYFEAREYKVRLKGELGYPVTLGTDTFGNITRLDNALEGLPKRLEMNGMELDNLKKQFETAKVDVERPFPQEEELKANTDRLNELNALLNVDKRENEIVGGEPDEGEELPEKKPRDLER